MGGGDVCVDTGPVKRVDLDMQKDKALECCGAYTVETRGVK